MKTRLLLLSLFLLIATAVSAQQRGDWVLGQWRGGDYWFPGVIESRSENSVTIVYDDGTRETLGLHLIRPYNWKEGTKIECRWKNGKEWYAGRITRVSKDGTTIDVLYNDGDRETLPTGGCRSS